MELMIGVAVLAVVLVREAVMGPVPVEKTQEA